MKLENVKKFLPFTAISIFFLLLALIFSFNISGYYNTCISTFDISIYQEAIYKIAHNFDLNPFLNVREIKIFNDHFDPIILLAVIFVWIFGYTPVSLLLFQMLWPLLCSLLIFYHHKFDYKKVALCLFIFIFSRGITGGLVFPLHPITWSMFPIMLLVYFIKKEHHRGIVITSVALMLFKETFPFAILGLSFFYLLRKNLKTFFWLFLSSIAWLFFLYVLREKMLGEVYPHSKRITDVLFADPFGFFYHRLVNDFNYKDFFNLFLPYIIPLIFIIKTEIKSVKNCLSHFLAPTFFFILPILGIHIIANYWFNWNGVFFASALGAVIFFSSFTEKIFEHKKTLALILFIFVINGSKFHEKAFKLFVMNDSKTCTISKEKSESLKKAREIINNIDKTKNIYATSGFIPWAMKPWLNIYPLGGGEWPLKKRSIDILVLERNHHGFLTPLTEKDIENWINKCEQKATTLYKNQYIIIMEGPFDSHCLSLINNKLNFH